MLNLFDKIKSSNKDESAPIDNSLVCDQFISHKPYLSCKDKEGEQGHFKSHDEFCDIVSLLNDLRKDDALNFQKRFSSLGITPKILIRVFQNGVPFNPYSNNQPAGTVEEMTLLTIATCYGSTNSLKILNPLASAEHKRQF